MTDDTNRHPHLVPAHIEPSDRWQDHAACRGMDPDIFFPDNRGGAQDLDRWGPARRICAPCPVRDKCLQTALDDNETAGVFGGMTPTQRKAMRQRNPRNSTETKVCSKCCVTRGIYDFHRSAASADGHKPHCKACTANYDADRPPRDYTKEARG